eukprot:g3688.t1
MNSSHTDESLTPLKRKRTEREAEEEETNVVETVLKNHHYLSSFGLPEYLDPRSRINARTALRDKEGWIPKQVMQYVEERREKGEALIWDADNLGRVVKEDKFELVKWAGALNEYVKENLCERATKYGKLHMLKWARKQQPPLPMDKYVLQETYRNGHYDTLKLGYEGDSSNYLCLLAFNNGHYDTLKWLIENGCPWDDRQKTNFLRYVSAFENAEQWKNIVVNQFIYGCAIHGEMTTCMMACNFGHTELVRDLLARNGVNVNMGNGWGMTDLVFACRNGKLEVVKLLLEHNDINVNQVNEEGWTALHWASEGGRSEVVKAMFSHWKTDVNQADNQGETALHLASYEGHVEVVKIILSHPKFTKVNEVSKDGQTAFLFASNGGHLEVVKAILSHPKFTNVNQVTWDEQTALHLASSGGHIEVVKALLSHPNFTNVNQADEDGETALDVARSKGNTEVAEAILSHPKFTKTAWAARAA